MKCTILLLAAGFLFNSSFAQLGALEGQNTIYLTNLSGRPLSLLDRTDLEGSPFFDERFKEGTIITKDGSSIKDVPMRFNIYNNELQFKDKKGNELAAESVRFAVYLENERDSSTIKVFAAGYPSSFGNNTSTLYQLLGGGKKYHFLKHHSQKIEQKKTMGYFHLKEFVLYTQLYVYTDKGGLKKVKSSQSDIMSALPEMKDAITRIAKEKKLNLRNEADIAILFNELDKQ